jgi:hypothetical protein
MNEQGRRTIHYTELPPSQPDDPLNLEWETYRREVGRLLAEGKEGKFVLIKGQEILGLYDSWDAARDAGLERYLREAFLVHPVRTWEPLLRIRGYSLPWPISLSR